jgi:hypothetical protein
LAAIASLLVANLLTPIFAVWVGILAAAVLAAPFTDWKSMRELGAALVPIALPLVMFALILALSAPVTVQFVLAAVAGCLYFAFLAPAVGIPQLLPWMNLTLLLFAFGTTLFVVPVVGVLIFIVVTSFVPDAFRGLGTFGGFETILEGLALTLTAAAVVFRLLAFATSPLRKLFVAALSATVFSYLMVAGAPASVGDWFGSSGWLWAVRAILAATAGTMVIAESVERRRSLSPLLSRICNPAAPSFTSGTGRIGGLLAGGGAAAIATALVVSVTDIRVAEHAHMPVIDALHLPEAIYPYRIHGYRINPYLIPDTKTAGLTKAQKQKIAEDFAPVLEYPRGERWHATSVDGFVRGALLTAPFARARTVQTPRQLRDKTCSRGTAAPCFTLHMNCGTDANCLKSGCFDGERRCARGGFSGHNYVYARVVERGVPPADGSPDPFRSSSPYGKQLRVLVQYWLFYDYDEWKRWTPIGVLTQRHEGDWEAVTVGLGARQPLFIALTEHCGGSWHDWRQIGSKHAFIGVAEGSHANYLGAYAKRAPDWAGCRHRRGFANVLSYISNIRDVTGADSIRPLATVVKVLDARKVPMSFPGFWGGFAEIRLKTGFRSRQKSHDNKGPATPTFQALWQNPLGTIFCSDAWQPKDCASKNGHAVLENRRRAVN